MTDEMTYDTQGLLVHEKTAIREELRVFARAHPARIPLSIRMIESFEQAFYNPRLQLSAGALALVLAGGSGTAFAAQSALPGDALYGVKVNIEEPIMGAFATSPEAQANWNAQLAGIRLSEAEQLAAQNKLSPAAAATIASGLSQATNNFDASVAQIATSSSDAATVVTVTSNMEATLAANSQVMSDIASSVPDTATTLQPILASVQERSASLNVEADAARLNVSIAAQASSTTAAQLSSASTSATSTASASLLGTSDATSSGASSTVSETATSSMRLRHERSAKTNL